MKKMISFIGVLLGWFFMTITPVFALDVSTPDNSGDNVWNTFVTKYSKTEAIESVGASITSDDDSLEITHKFVDMKDQNLTEKTGKIVFSYNAGVLELVQYTDEYTISDYVNTALEVYADMYGYSKLAFYFWDNMENPDVLKNIGIDFTGHSYFTKEEIDKIISDTNLPDGGWGFLNPFVCDTFKLNISQPLKNYDESTIPLYYVYNENNEELKFDVTKDATVKFTCDGPFDLFDKIYVDGVEVDSTNYTVTEGSTIVEFKSEYVKKLSVGKHTLKFGYTDGEFGTTSFEITQSIANPNTYFTFNYVDIALIIVLLVGGYFVVKKVKFN